MLSPVTIALILLVAWAWVCMGNVIYFIGRWYGFSWQLKADKEVKERVKLKQVAVIEAVKNIESGYYGHVNALIGQDYPGYRVIFCLSDSIDPAFVFLSEFFNLDHQGGAESYHLNREQIPDRHCISEGLISVEIVLAGQAVSSSQKIHNHLAAYERITNDDRLLTWVDADTELTESWLWELVHPLQEKQLAAVSGYRCLVPGGTSWASAATAVMNASILTLLGDRWRNSMWGGSMAMTYHTFETFNIPVYLSRCFSDDASLGALLKKKGVPIYFSFSVLPLGKINYSFFQMINFGRRQYLCARYYYKFHLFIAWFLLSGFTLAFFILLIQTLSNPTGTTLWLFWGLTAAMCLRGLVRFWFIRYVLGHQAYGYKCLFLETIGTPIIHLIHLMICYAALVGQRVEWAGITYKIKGPFHVKIL